MKPITLYGGAFSLYTGRARSYLIKSRIDYREEPHASEHYYNMSCPKRVGDAGCQRSNSPMVTLSGTG